MESSAVRESYRRDRRSQFVGLEALPGKLDHDPFQTDSAPYYRELR